MALVRERGRHRLQSYNGLDARRAESVRIQLIGKSGRGPTGTSRYTTDLCKALQRNGIDVQLTAPARAPVPEAVKGPVRRLGWDVEAFWASYPLHATLHRDADIYHLTSQTLAILLLCQRFRRPAVVTVLDILPYLLRKNNELNTIKHPVDFLFYRLALAGLRRASACISISQYTKQTLVKALGLPEDLIHVIYPSVDHDKFHPMAVPASFWQKYELEEKGPYVLCVGSDDPRKNLPLLMQALALMKPKTSEMKLLKVGSPQFGEERIRLRSLISTLGLRDDVLFFDHVPDEDLPLFYNAAQVFVMPSLYEGFGLPALEAMACGTAVVCANTGSLPEVVGESGLQVSPRDPETLASRLLELLQSEERRLDLARSGQERAACFTWEREAREVQELYAAFCK